MRLDDWTTVTRAHSIAEPTSDYETVFAVALRLLREYAPARPVRLLGVRVAGLTHGEREADSGEMAAGRGAQRRAADGGLDTRRCVRGADGVAGLTAVARLARRAVGSPA